MTEKQDPEKLQFLLESKFFSFKTAFPNEVILETGLLELMQDDARQPKRPYETQKVTKKSEKTCAVCCIMGEKALAACRYNKALKAFTNALRVAPASSKMIAHCYYWRSLALEKLKAFSESLQDIERALQLFITDKQKASLISRRELVQKLLQKSNPRKSTKKMRIEEEVTLSYGENPEISGVSSALALNYNIKYGRHFLATRDIEIGDVLMIQKPFTIVISKEGEDGAQGKEWYCENCLKLTKAPIPCDTCAMLFYCSTECRSEAYEKFHKFECKLANISAPLGPFSSLFLRTMLLVTKQGEQFQEAVKLMEDVKKHTDKRTSGFKDGKLDGCSSEAVLSLLHHIDKQNLTTLVSNAAQVACSLKKHTDFFKESNDVRSLANLMIFVSYICHRNFYCLRRHCSNNIIAVTLYPVMNLLNHSCVCNTLSYNDIHGTTILRACKNIKKGEQVFVSYNTFDVMIWSAKQRREGLQANKFFTCECEACARNYTYTAELKGTLKVPMQLQHQLADKNNDTDALWKLLKLVLEAHLGPSLEAKSIELALVEAYLGSDNKDRYQALINLDLL